MNINIGDSSRGLGSYHDGRDPNPSLNLLWHRFCVKKGLRKRKSPERINPDDFTQFSYVNQPADPTARIFKGKICP